MKIFVLVLSLAAAVSAQQSRPAAPRLPDPPPPAIVPLPSSLTVGAGAFTLTPATVIVTDAASRALGRQLAAMLAPATGFDLDVRVAPQPNAPRIQLRQDKTLARALGTEGYRLHVTPEAITVAAAAPAGVFYALQTIRQMLPPAIYRDAPAANVIWRMRAVTIEDVPRFSWRGSHLDVSRHFLPKEFVKKYIDLLAMHKMNRFHWHLTDDQGWRLEIIQYPRLTTVAGWRAETLIGHDVNNPALRKFDGIPHGGFYTQDDAREIVAYAAARFITVIPEIEMPGHSQAVVSAYPELGSTSDPVQPRTNWGVSEFLLNPDDSTIKFMQNVLGEVLAVFPGPWIHIGGDEAVKNQWKANPKIQERIKALNLKNEDALQSWFIQQMDTFLTSKGRQLIGWDEILDGGLAERAAVMSWRSVDHAVTAARSGHDAVLTPTSNTYFDYYQTRDTAKEPLAIGGFLPLDRVYNWEPMPTALEPQFQSHILGVQAQLWTEYMAGPKNVEYMAFPRLCAMAEVAWTPATLRKLDEFLSRMSTHQERLRVLDVNFRPLQ